MNKVRMAEYHYRRAAEIHPTNAILIGCIGLVSSSSLLVFLAVFFTMCKTKERVGDNETAIQLYGKAIEYCPENALVRYRRGKLLIGIRQYKVRRYYVPSASRAHPGVARRPRFGVLERSLSR